MRTLLLVGRNSKPRSSHGTGISAVPGFFNACSTEAYSLECLENFVGCVVTVKAEAFAQKRAANSGSLIMVTGDAPKILWREKASEKKTESR
jgi:hypothetical protein